MGNIDNLKSKKISKKIEIEEIKEFKEIKSKEIAPRKKRKPVLKKHLKTCLSYLLLVIKTKIFARILYFLTFIIFLFLLKILGLVDVYKDTSEFLIKALSYIGGLL